MSKRESFVCRFAVGDPNGGRASVWRIWAGRSGSDLYIAARAVAGKAKVSIHASGERQAGLTAQYAAELDQQGSWKGASRHFRKWSHGVAIGQDCSVEFQICFPTEHLARFGGNDLPEREVTWIPAAPEDQMVSVNVVLGPKGETFGWPGRRQGALLVGQGRLKDRTRIWVVARNLPMGILHGKGNLAAHLARIAADMERQRFRPTETHRLVIVFRDDVGVHGFAELSADALMTGIREQQA